MVKAPVPCKVPVKVALSLLGALNDKLLKNADPVSFSSPVTLVVITTVTEVPANKSVKISLKDCLGAQYGSYYI